MDGVQSDKVNINLGGGDGGGGGLGGAGLAAVIAALGNRNEGGDTAGLIAALGNRNNDGMGMAALAPLLAANSGGMNNLWPIILLALLGRRGGFGFGDGDGTCGAPGGVGPGLAALLQTLTEGQSNIRAEIPTTALETQNAIQSSISSLALGAQQGFANVKDAVQVGVNFLDRDIQMTNQNVSSQGCQTREAVQNDGDKTRALLVARFQQEDATRIAELNAEVVELRNESRRRADHDDLRIQISNNNVATATQSQAQAQFQVQSQFDRLFGAINVLGAQVQRVRADQDIVNLGTMVASGTQATTSTQVR